MMYHGNRGMRSKMCDESSMFCILTDSAMWVDSRNWLPESWFCVDVEIYPKPHVTFPIKCSRIAFVGVSLWWNQASSIFRNFKKDRSKKYSKTKKLKIYFWKIFLKFGKIEKSKKMDFNWKCSNFRNFGFSDFRFSKNFNWNPTFLIFRFFEIFRCLFFVLWWL